MAVCSLCEIDVDTVKPHQSWDEEKNGFVVENLCNYCWSKFLDPSRAGDKGFGGQVLPPRPYPPGQNPPVSPGASNLPKPEDWPTYVPWPPMSGYPMPPGFVWDDKGIRKK